MVGGAVPKLKLKFGCNDAVMIIESIGFCQYSGEVDQDYITKYIPPVLQHSDKDGLNMIKPYFSPFARDLMKFCVDANRNKSISELQRRESYSQDTVASRFPSVTPVITRGVAQFYKNESY